MKHKQSVPRERNHLVALAKFRRAGVHGKTTKAQRKQDKQNLNKSQGGDYFAVNSTNLVQNNLHDAK